MSRAVEISLLGRLLETGIARCSARSQALINRFETARWIDQSGRKDEWKLRESAAGNLANRLNELMPSWKEDFAFLRSISRDPFDPKDIEAIPYFRRPVTVAGMINRRNWSAAKGLGPKHRARIPSNVTLTKDWVMRFRPNKGLCGKIGDVQVNFNEISALWSECFIPERAWINLLDFSGVLPSFIVTCENLGAYIDLPANEGMMIVFAPGADTEPTIRLLDALPNSPWIHFGDLDHEGIEIAQHISAETGRKLELFIPSFAVEYLGGAPDVKSTWDQIPDLPLFADLKRNKKRIFQEVFMLDGRLADELVSLHQKLT